MQIINGKKRGFAKDFLFKGYFLIALTVAAFFSTTIYAAYEFDIFNKIANKDGAMLFSSISFGILALLTLAYVFNHAFKKDVTIGDSLSCSMIIIAILYTVFIVIKRYFDAISIIVPAALYVFGISAFIISVFKYDRNSVSLEPVYVNNNPVNYLKAVFTKYSALSVALVAALISSCFYLCLNNGVRSIFLDLAEQFLAIYILSGAALGLFVIFLVCGLFIKKVNHADLALVSLFFALVISLLQVIFVLKNPTKQFIELAVAAGVWLVLMLIRTFTAKVTENYIEKERSGYFANLFSKYSPLFILAVATLVSATSILIYKFDLPVIFLDFFKGLFYSDIIVIMFFAIAVADIFTVGVGLLFSISTIGARKVTLGDFIIATSLVCGIVTLPLIFVNKLIVTNVAIGIIAFTAFSLILFVLRVVIYKIKNKKVN